AHELPLARRAVGVTIVFHGARPAHTPEQLPGLVYGARRAEAVGAADELSTRQVEAGEPHLVLEHRVRLADRSGRAAVVLQRDVALRRAIHLDDARDAEAFLEERPDVGSQSRAGADTELVVAVGRRGRLAQQVAAELAHVHEGDRAMAADVVEEGAGAEASAGREGSTD